MASPTSGPNSAVSSSPPGTAPNGGAPLDRIRQMLLVPPAVRPPEFENPLEKIEQLLTCPICLDRYKQPKLLPCHHTFCLPCLDNCVDVVHRVLKCPECRAEHPVPYDGVKNFQSNYTLMGFLDIHLQATDDNAAQLEAYIQRYNLERCKVCDEKAVLDVCAHCDRRACSDCRTTHLEMLKRDLTRMLNQVKRLSNRITEASDGLSKGTELLTLNCETAKDEVKEYFRRYYRELKKREEMFIEEIETFHATETRLMRNLRDVLEIESSNMSEGCAYLEAALKGEREVHDSELVKLKNVFSEGLEYLRNFQPDADELFSKKLRFSPGDDASKLPSAIANFGELTVMLPQFAGRYLPLEQSYLPRPMKIGYESDSYKYASKRASDLDDGSAGGGGGGGGRAQNDFFRGTVGRYGMRLNAGTGADEDMMSIRYRRRQQMEEEAWNRLRAENFDNSGQSPGGGSTGTSGGGGGSGTGAGGGTCYTPGNSPWSRTVVASGVTSPVAADTNAITRNNLTAAAAKVAAECLQPAGTTATSNGSSPDEQGGKVLVVPKGVVLHEARPKAESTTHIVARNQSASEIRQSDVIKVTAADTIAAAVATAKATTMNQQNAPKASNQTTGIPNSNSHIPVPIAVANHPNMDTEAIAQPPPPVVKLTKKPPLPRQISSDDTSLNEKIENIRTAHEMRRANRTQKPTLKESVSLDATTRHSNSSSNGNNNSSDESECENEPSRPVQTGGRFRIICRSASDTKEPVVHQRSDPTPFSAAAQEAIAAEGASLPIPILHYPGEQLPPWLARRRQRYQRSKTNPDLIAALAAMSGQQSSLASLAFPSACGNNNNISSTSTTSQAPPSSSRVQQLLLERSSRFAGGGPLMRQDSDKSDLATVAAAAAAASSSTSHQDRRSRFRKRSNVSDRDNSLDGRLMQAPRFICTVDYLSKGKPRLVFGKKGSKEGELNWPRGVTAIGGNEFAVCDSSNHRVCVFNTGGRLLRMFGKYGTGDAQLDSAAGVCCGRFKHLIVSDRYNHRIMIFDQSGQYVKQFGGHGPSSGRFNNPWGVAVDDMGMIYVVDKDNHRVQMFDSKGQFAGKFGTMGPGLGQFHHPQFIAIHKRTQNIYVTDSSNHRVCVFDHNGNPIFQFGVEGYQNGQMKFPRGIAVDDQGFIIVADSGNNRVQIFYPDGRYMHSFGTWGNAPGQLKGVEAVALIDTTIIVSDRENHRIQLF